MRTPPPDLADDVLIRVLRSTWGIDAADVVYRPVGFGSHHWSVDDGHRWFVTVDDLAARRWDSAEPPNATFDRLRAALTAARQLADGGLAFVIAPEPSVDGDVLVPIDQRFALAVYPHVDGAARGYGDFDTLDDRLAVLELVIDVHGADAGSARADDLVVPMRDELLTALTDLGRPWAAGPLGEPARILLREHEASIRSRLAEHAQLAARTLAQPERFVLTHGEPHPGNTMHTAHGVVLVDWDTALLAPPERDLWTISGPGRDPVVLDAYTTATGVPVDHGALDTYRLHWDVTEIALYTALLHAGHDDTADVWESFTNLRHFLETS